MSECDQILREVTTSVRRSVDLVWLQALLGRDVDEAVAREAAKARGAVDRLTMRAVRANPFEILDTLGKIAEVYAAADRELDAVALMLDGHIVMPVACA